LNKLDRPPSEWFRNPGKNSPPYSEEDLAERRLTWADLAPEGFDSMLRSRGAKIKHKAEQLFALTEADFNSLFVDEIDSVELEERGETFGRVRTYPALLATKRRQAIEAFGRLKGVDLARRGGSDALFWSADKTLCVCCTLSKRYERAAQPYWYGYHPAWDEFLAGGADSYFILACLDTNVGFAIPFRWMTENKKKLSMTDRVEESFWQVPLTTLGDGTLAVLLSRAESTAPLEPWAFSFGEAAEHGG
jgi:hypothetical protein